MGGFAMATSYNRLWKLLIDLGMKKGELCRKADISTTSLAKMGNGSPVNTTILEKICAALDCNYGDIMDYVPEKSDDKTRDSDARI
jgi:DNA-binding Xre family transcriptional regulator